MYRGGESASKERESTLWGNVCSKTPLEKQAWETFAQHAAELKRQKQVGRWWDWIKCRYKMGRKSFIKTWHPHSTGEQPSGNVFGVFQRHLERGYCNCHQDIGQQSKGGTKIHCLKGILLLQLRMPRSLCINGRASTKPPVASSIDA